jgi:hypothetical protein
MADCSLRADHRILPGFATIQQRGDRFSALRMTPLTFQVAAWAMCR